MRTCSFDGCDRTLDRAQFCKGHLQQQRRSGQMKPIKRKASKKVYGVEPCDFEGCKNLKRTRQWCGTHWLQQREGRKMKKAANNGGVNWTIDLLLAESIKDGECLLFRSHQAGKYPVINVRGETMSAHRFSYKLATGEDITGVPIHHKCGNTKCIRPDHLQRASHAENILEMLGRKAYEAEIARLKAENAQLRAILLERDSACG